MQGTGICGACKQNFYGTSHCCDCAALIIVDMAHIILMSFECELSTGATCAPCPSNGESNPCNRNVTAGYCLDGINGAGMIFIAC
jgi:hypothetical protein